MIRAFIFLAFAATLAALGVQATQGVRIGMFGLALLALSFIWRFAKQMRERETIARATLAAYAEQNPSCVIAGEITCSECNSDKISPMTDKKHSDFWQHCCQDCGTTLYFTKK